MKYNSINNAKHYFTLPNEIFCLGLSSGEIAVYSYLFKHLISTERTEVITKDGRKRNGTLLYTIRPIAEAIDYFHSEQLRRNA